MRESLIEQGLVRRVRSRGGVCLKWTSPGYDGVPDRIVFLPGRIVFVELKAPGKKPTALQLKVHAKLRALGAEVLVIDSREGVNAFLP